MLLWFVGLAVVVVWLVFRSPSIDYRMVVVGAVLPLGDLVTGGVWVLHTLVASVAALLIVVLLTFRRRLVRRRWLGLPIGMFLHLVLDGMWTRTAAFWWPLFGWESLGGTAPEVFRGPVLIIVQELAGVIAIIWFARTFRLGEAENRLRLLRTGQLPRDVAREE
ncbi:MAG: hypothetical protein ACRD0A_15490 [Acidimicrobiales bacterium]